MVFHHKHDDSPTILPHFFRFASQSCVGGVGGVPPSSIPLKIAFAQTAVFKIGLISQSFAFCYIELQESLGMRRTDSPFPFRGTPVAFPFQTVFETRPQELLPPLHHSIMTNHPLCCKKPRACSRSNHFTTTMAQQNSNTHVARTFTPSPPRPRQHRRPPDRRRRPATHHLATPFLSSAPVPRPPPTASPKIPRPPRHPHRVGPCRCAFPRGRRPPPPGHDPQTGRSFSSVTAPPPPSHSPRLPAPLCRLPAPALRAAPRRRTSPPG